MFLLVIDWQTFGTEAVDFLDDSSNNWILVNIIPPIRETIIRSLSDNSHVKKTSDVRKLTLSFFTDRFLIETTLHVNAIHIDSERQTTTLKYRLLKNNNSTSVLVVLSLINDYERTSAQIERLVRQ